MVKKVLKLEDYTDSNAHKNNMRLDYIEGLMDAVNELPETDFECDCITAAIKVIYEASFELEDALAKISKQ